MDLSKILSPVIDVSQQPLTPQARSEKWSDDEMECALSILNDFGCASGIHSAKKRKMSEEEKEEEEEEDVKKVNKLNLLVQATNEHLLLKTQEQELDEDHDESPASTLRQSTTVSGADGSTASPTSQRSGVWTREEEEYAAALIYYFLQGMLQIKEGTTLRKFIAEKLCCNRRRVSMKLASETLAAQKIPRKVGASVFVVRKPQPTREEYMKVDALLQVLREKCFTTSKGNVSHPSTVNKIQRPEIKHTPVLEVLEPKSSPPSAKRVKARIIRTGFDTPQEEEYVTHLCQYFQEGLLEIDDGKRLGPYLCEMLECKPRSLSMKLAPKRLGQNKFPQDLGAIVFKRKMGPCVGEEISIAKQRLYNLHQRYVDTLKDPNSQKSNWNMAIDSTDSSTSTLIKVPTTPTIPNSEFASKSLSTIYTRSGPWTHEEECYAAGLIEYFYKGVLDIPEGTTLRAFLATKLLCNPMRVSKKLATETIAQVKIPKKLGSSTFVSKGFVSEEEREQARVKLEGLHEKYVSILKLKYATLEDDSKQTLRFPPGHDFISMDKPPMISHAKLSPISSESWIALTPVPSIHYQSSYPAHLIPHSHGGNPQPSSVYYHSPHFAY
jgi:hypothetical protein